MEQSCAEIAVVAQTRNYLLRSGSQFAPTGKRMRCRNDQIFVAVYIRQQIHVRTNTRYTIPHPGVLFATADELLVEFDMFRQ
jgi:hypothetical protein